MCVCVPYDFLQTRSCCLQINFYFCSSKKKKKGTISGRNRWTDDGWMGTGEGGRKGGRGKKKEVLFPPKEKNHWCQSVGTHV